MANLNGFFNPRSVAVIGASRDPDKVGYAILESMTEKYKGEVYPVNPNAKSILALKCYPSIKEVGKVDLAIIAVPKGFVSGVLRDCVSLQIENAVIVTAGYSEMGDQKSEDELRKIIKGSKTRLIGVNCLGVLDGHSNVDTLFLPRSKLPRPKGGNISFISQSGAFGSVLLDLIAYEDIGISKFISYGNQTDLKDVDFLEYLGNDNKTEVVVIYMEGVSDGRKFMEVARRVSRKKPIIIFKAGKSKAGSEAASSHTGALAGSYRVYQAAFKQSGIIEALSIEEMFDFSKCLELGKLPKGKKIVAITNGGGFGVITSDFMEQWGLDPVKISKSSEKKLKTILPKYAGIHNPLDLIGDADKERYKKVLEILVDDKCVDGIIVISLLQPVPVGPEVIDVVNEIARKTDKPIVICATGGEYTLNYIKKWRGRGVPIFAAPERAVKAIWSLVKYSEIKK